MDRSRGPLLASPIVIVKPAEGPRLRRKLQKIAKQRNHSEPPRRPGSGAPSAPNASNGSLPNKCDRGTSKLGKLDPHAQVKPSIPLAPDLTDSRWLDHLRRSGYLYTPDSSAQSREPSRVPDINVIPELSHLRFDDLKPKASLNRLAPNSASSSTSSIMRRRAKTPVFSIGQLESLPLDRELHPPDPKASNVELIAESYRALLESRMSMLTDSHSEPPPSREGEDDVPVEIRRNSSDELHANLPPEQLPGASLISDDTLVAFDDETVYFKPVSFSPEPHSPRQEQPLSILSPSLAPDNLSLQICLELLTRELAAAMSDRPQRSSSSEVASLQIWVMIEAYERLRDQLLETRLRPDELGPLEMMFDMWLRALYTIHDSMTGEARSNESDYESLDVADLD